jgi:phosphatidate cytidylyltransferase
MAGADDQYPDDAPSGRHGDSSGGLSAADLIARARAAAPGGPERPSRSARRAVLEPTEPDAETPSLRHLAAVDDLIDLESAVPAEPTEKKSRAGRNLPVAIAVGVGLGALILGTLFSYRPSFIFVLIAAILVGVYEVVTAISTVEARPPLVPLLVGAAAMDAAAWFRGPDGLVGALLLTVIGLAIWRLGDGASGYLRDLASASFIAVYVPFLAGFAALLAHPDDGAARIVIFILSVVCSDTGGYATGVLFGRHPMAPTVSPKKSWEGFVGSALACCACGMLVMHFSFHEDWWKGAVYGLAIVITATLGDLGESMIKRDLGLKDMGRLLPGHGGIMDRLDSLLPCAAVAYLLLALFVPA